MALSSFPDGELAVARHVVMGCPVWWWPARRMLPGLQLAGLAAAVAECRWWPVTRQIRAALAGDAAYFQFSIHCPGVIHTATAHSTTRW